jgi:phosphohistidine phosphatase SixA
MRHILAFLFLACALFQPVWAQNISGNVFAKLKAGGVVILMRHSQTTPGVGDPPNFKLDDCATQRNLNDAGRAQARQLGQRLRANAVQIAKVTSSAWCRCMDTAKLLAPSVPPAVDDSLGSYWQRDDASVASAAAQVRAQIKSWRGPGVWLMVTHQVNIIAIVGANSQQGGFAVIEPRTLGVIATANP